MRSRHVAVCMRPSIHRERRLAGWPLHVANSCQQPTEIDSERRAAPHRDLRPDRHSLLVSAPGCDHSQKHESEMPSRMCKRRSPHEQATGLAAAPLSRISSCAAARSEPAAPRTPHPAASRTAPASRDRAQALPPDTRVRRTKPCISTWSSRSRLGERARRVTALVRRTQASRQWQMHDAGHLLSSSPSLSSHLNIGHRTLVMNS